MAQSIAAGDNGGVCQLQSFVARHARHDDVVESVGVGPFVNEQNFVVEKMCCI